MNGMLLAAGRGQRMAPLSHHVAKPALDVLGRPLLAASLDALSRCCDRIVVNLHHRPRQVLAAVYRASASERAPKISWEPQLLGGAGGIAAARSLLGPGPLLLGNADVWSALDLAPLLAAADPKTVTLALMVHPDPSRWSLVNVDRDGRVAGFARASAKVDWTPLLFTGFQLVGEAALAGLPAAPGEIAGVLWESLRASGRLRGVVVEGVWHEAGSPAAYRDMVSALLYGGNRVDACSSVAANVVLEGSSVGPGCYVESGCRLRESLVTEGASLGPGCDLERTVIAGDVALPAGTCCRNELIVPSCRIPLA
jgi:NDP-sugar pyrophosphorylase family protein